MPRSMVSRAPGALSLSGSVGLGAGNAPADVASLQQAMVAAGALSPNPRNLLYDPHDGRFLDAVLTLQEKLGVRQSGLIKAGSAEERTLRRALATQARTTQAQPGGQAPGSAPQGSLHALRRRFPDVDRGYRIAKEVEAKWPANSPDPLVDAMRHAEWNRRMTEELGPGRAYLFSLTHEVGNVARENHGLGEAQMDVHNNSVGISAGRSGHPIDPRDLDLSQEFSWTELPRTVWSLVPPREVLPFSFRRPRKMY